MTDEILNIIFSSDDNYAQHLGVAIYSLLSTNKEFQKIKIFIIDNEISEENKRKLIIIISEFKNADIKWISFSKWKSQLNLNMQWEISISTYARLFIADMLPEDIEKILYLDCDMIIQKSIVELWSANLNGNIIGAVQDTINDLTKKSIGLNQFEKYFNAGMLLIDLKQWRKDNIGRACLNFIDEKHGSVTHHDQGTLNGVLKGKWTRLPLKYNIMTIHYIFSPKQIKKYYNDHSDFYDLQEVDTAKRNPVILHYTPSFTTRPWIKNCKHPLKYLYWNAIENTPWNGMRPQKDHSKWYIKLQNCRSRSLPY